MPTPRKGLRYLGPYYDPGRKAKQWRLVRVHPSGQRETLRYTCRDEAEAVRDAMMAEIDMPELSTGQALDMWIAECQRRDRSRNTILGYESAWKRFFPEPSAPLWGIKERYCRKAYERLVDAGYAVDTHRNALAMVKTVWKWLAERHYVMVNPVEHIEGVGSRSHGKEQLTRTEARAFFREAYKQACEGVDGPIGALLCLVMGLRSSEICSLTVRDFDEDVLQVKKSKTRKGIRELELPDVLVSLLADCAKGRQSGAPLFPTGEAGKGKAGEHHQRSWVAYWVRKLCDDAGVTRVPPHGLRGTASSLAHSAGMMGVAVAQSMGHEDTRTTERSYAKQGAVQTGGVKRRLGVLQGGKA